MRPHGARTFCTNRSVEKEMSSCISESLPTWPPITPCMKKSSPAPVQLGLGIELGSNPVERRIHHAVEQRTAGPRATGSKIHFWV